MTASPPARLHVAPIPAQRAPNAIESHQGLGAVGIATVPTDLSASFGLPLALPLYHQAPIRASFDVDGILHTLVSHGLLFPSQPAALVFVTAKTPDETRFLLHLGTLNANWPTPPRFPLPTLSPILDIPGAHIVFTIRRYMSNLFWPLHLPHTVLGCSALPAGGRTFGLRRRPSGGS